VSSPYVLFVIAGIALATGMWLAVRRPPPACAARVRVRWHAGRATLAATSASLSALCVLLALGKLQA
jgi:hypothetical protein